MWIPEFYPVGEFLIQGHCGWTLLVQSFRDSHLEYFKACLGPNRRRTASWQESARCCTYKSSCARESMLYPLSHMSRKELRSYSTGEC